MSRKTPRDDIFSRFSVIHNYSRWLGLAGYTIEGPPGSRIVRRSKLYTIVTFPLHLTIVIYCCYTYIQGLKILVPSPVLTFVAVLFLTIDTATFTVNIIFNRINVGKTVFFLRELLAIEKELVDIGVRFEHAFSRNVALILWGFEVLITIVFNAVFLSGIPFTIELVLLSILRYYEFFTQIALDFQFLTVTSSLKCLFEKLNNKLADIPPPEITNKLVLLHQNLCRLTRRYNATLSLPILLRFGISFCVLLTQVFNFVVWMASHSWITIQILMAMNYIVVFSLVKIMSFIVVSSSCMNEVRRTKNVITKVLTSVTDEAEFRKNLNAFSLQILHEEFQIRAGGFFTMDATLGLSILTSLILYTLILVQFGINNSLGDVLGQQ